MCSKNSEHTWDAVIYSRIRKRSTGCPYCTYKSEQACREILENILGISFKKCRSKFLDGLEFDGYNKKYKIAFEYQGRQHTKYISIFPSEWI